MRLAKHFLLAALLLLSTSLFGVTPALAATETSSSEDTAVAETQAESAGDAEASKEKPEPVTTGDPEVPVDQLELMVMPLTQEELVVEADAWLALLQAKVAEISEVEIEAKQEKQAAEEAQDGEASQSGESAEEAAAAQTKLLEQVTGLRTQRTALVDRLNAVLKELQAKGGDITQYQLYTTAVQGIKVDVSDTKATWTAILGWLRSEEGGIRWAKNIGLFVGVLAAFYFLALILSKAADKALHVAGAPSDLLHRFIVKLIRGVTMALGVLMGLAVLEVSIGPLLAIIGAAGFAIAFALQSTLSNFASGLMILLYRPFDVDDIVDVAGASGTVKAMNMVSTVIDTFDNKRMVVPNNTIWGNIITNATRTDKRRVDLVFGISYSDDIDKARQIMEDAVNEHSLVLEDPEPVIRLHELADSSVNFVCRPWAKTDDLWDVYWDIMRTVKMRFDEEGISIPFPQRDIHVHQVESPKPAPSSEEPQRPARTTSPAPEHIEIDVPNDSTVAE